MEQILQEILERLDKIEKLQEQSILKMESIEDWQDTNARIEDQWRESIKNNFFMIDTEQQILMQGLADISPAMAQVLREIDHKRTLRVRISAKK